MSAIGSVYSNFTYLLTCATVVGNDERPWASTDVDGIDREPSLLDLGPK